jgi:hypothetical protein
VEKYTGVIFRTCCDGCDLIWADYIQYHPEKLMDLYFYRVKVPDKLKADDIGDLYWSDFSYLQLQIILELKGGPMTAPDLVEKIFGLGYTEQTGMLKHRTHVIAECKRLNKIGIVRSYRAKVKSVTARAYRPRTKYTLTAPIVTLKRKCPNCHNSNYRVLEKIGRVKCLYCGLEWEVPASKPEIL